jgi:hypothetical protein
MEKSSKKEDIKEYNSFLEGPAGAGVFVGALSIRDLQQQGVI